MRFALAAVRAIASIACLCVSILLAVAYAHADPITEQLEYVVAPGAIYVYDIDGGFALRKVLELAPTLGSNIKGLAADPGSGTLFVSYGGDGGQNGSGSLLKYDLLDERVVWTRAYPHGIDSMAIASDGTRLYMPVGEEEKFSTEWKILDPATGDEVGSLAGARAPHNTVVGPSGAHVYLAGREDPWLYVRNTADGSLVTYVGPFMSSIRPFTVNGAETLVFTTHTGMLGFQVGRVADGAVIFTVWVDGFAPDSAFTTPSHGISLAPDEREVYVIDTANAYAHVFDVSGLPEVAPAQVASIKLTGDFSGKEQGCGTGWCGRISWLRHTLDGRFVLVGNSGDVIDTATRQVIAVLPALRDTRKMIEIDWAEGMPIAASPREGIGRRMP
ncbi:MAG: hypothetical protein M3336_06440 [Chloroflexota bacterium]|nr:hypothetical protein [Chloroflexota bacterium]